MKTKGRSKSNNIIDRRKYGKSISSVNEKGVFKIRDNEWMKIQPSGNKKSKYTKKKITHEKG